MFTKKHSVLLAALALGTALLGACSNNKSTTETSTSTTADTATVRTDTAGAMGGTGSAMDTAKTGATTK